MMSVNARNERVKHNYFGWLSAAKQLDGTTVDAVARDLADFEAFTALLEFNRFKSSHAVAYKKHLLKRPGARGKGRLSHATVYSTLRNLKNFFFWLADQPGYKSRLQHADSLYFNMSRKESAAAKVSRQLPVPSLEEVIQAVESMPAHSDAERRDRAIMALIAITGSRDDAVASMRLKHVDLDAGLIFHDPREMRIKFSKNYPTFLLDVDPRLMSIFVEWVGFLREDLGCEPDAALFPKSKTTFTKDTLGVTTQLTRECWSNAQPIRKLFKAAFARVELPDYKPHSLRKMLVRIGMKKCKTPEEFKAWSQNLGHEEVLTTLMSYGRVPDHRQGELLKRVMSRTDDDDRALELGWKMLETMSGE